MANKRNWMVRAGQGGFLLNEFLNKGIIAIGWNHLEELKKGVTSEELKQKLKEVYPDWGNGKFSHNTVTLKKGLKKCLQSFACEPTSQYKNP